MSATVAPALLGLVAIAGAMIVLWVVSVVRRDASIVDPFWAPGFLLVGSVYVAATPAEGRGRGLLTLAIVALWALRLGIHLFVRNRNEGEDPRYAAWRERHGPRFWWVSLFTVFLLQALILWVVSAPLLGAAAGRSPIGPLDALGAGIALFGLIFEAVADRQLRAFRGRRGTDGAVLDRGLWRYSRHPNYFGNAVLWWGLWLIALSAGAAWTVVGPLIMTFLLVRVSGVTLLERRLRARRPGYEEYVRRTSSFVPLPPRS